MLSRLACFYDRNTNVVVNDLPLNQAVFEMYNSCTAVHLKEMFSSFFCAVMIMTSQSPR